MNDKAYVKVLNAYPMYKKLPPSTFLPKTQDRSAGDTGPQTFSQHSSILSAVRTGRSCSRLLRAGFVGVRACNEEAVGAWRGLGLALQLIQLAVQIAHLSLTGGCRLLGQAQLLPHPVVLPLQVHHLHPDSISPCKLLMSPMGHARWSPWFVSISWVHSSLKWCSLDSMVQSPIRSLRLRGHLTTRRIFIALRLQILAMCMQGATIVLAGRNVARILHAENWELLQRRQAIEDLQTAALELLKQV